MPTPTFAPGDPCWIDLTSSDTARATAFYGGVLGWKAEEPHEGLGGYFTFTKDGRHVGGCMHNDGTTGMADGWTVYLATDDAEATAQATVAHGGTVDFGPMAIADNGVVVMLGDPGQGIVGAWQAGSQAGLELVGEVGSPNWFELHTRAYDECVAFYRAVFGWSTHVMSDTPDFRYTTAGQGETATAGVMDSSRLLPEGAPAAWSIYFGVADADAALETVVELGGTVIHPPHETEWGHLASVADPTGAAFRLLARP